MVILSHQYIQVQDVEVAVKRYEKGDKEGAHHHRKATEITVVVENCKNEWKNF